MNIGFYKCPIGMIRIEAEDNYIVGIDFVDLESKEIESVNSTILRCKLELQQYFEGERKEFTVPFTFIRGTEFQKLVWNELIKVPYGEKVSYKHIAEKINNPKAVRAVGGANNKNPIAIIVPCHRVVGANGKMVGYASGIDKKEYLLNLEVMNL